MSLEKKVESKKPVQRSGFSFLIDLLAFVGFVSLLTTGLVMRFILPSGTGPSRLKTAAKGTLLLGMDHHQWGNLHFWIACVLLGILTVHVLLHGKWLLAKVRGKPGAGSGWRLAMGMVGLLGLLVFAGSILMSPTTTKSLGSGKKNSAASTPGQKGGTPARKPFKVDGAMSLRQIEKNTGISAKDLRKRLGLPDKVSLDANLGQLKKQYKFEMQKVQDLVDTLRK